MRARRRERTRTALLGGIQDVIELERDDEVVGFTAADRVPEWPVDGAGRTERDHAARVHARESQFVPRRGVRGVVEDPGVVFHGVIGDPRRTRVGVEGVEHVGRVEGHAVGSDPRTLAVLRAFEEGPVEMSHDGAVFFGDPGLVSRARQRVGKVALSEGGVNQIVARRVVGETLARAAHDAIYIARLDATHDH